MKTPYSFVPENFHCNCLFQRAGFLFLFSLLLCAVKAQQAGKNTGASVSLYSKFYNRQDSVYMQAQPKKLSKSVTATLPANRGRNINGTCATSTFYLHIRAAGGEKIELKEIQTLPGGDFVLAGNIILSNNEKRGVLYLLSNNGNLLQQKYIQVNNLPVTLEQVRVKVTGEIVVAGMMSAIPQKIVLISLQSDLSVNWVKTIETPGPALKITLDFNENDLTMLAIRQASSIIYTIADKNGTALWVKEIAPAGLKELAGFTSVNYNYAMLILNCENAGKKSVLLIDIDIATGIVKDTHIAGNGNDEYEYNDLNTFNGRMLGFGVVKDPLQPFHLVRNIVPVSGMIETEHRYTLPSFIPGFGTSCTADNAGDAIAVSDAVGGSLFLIKHFADYQVTPEQTRRYNVPTGARVKAVARSFTDGGYLMGLNTVLLDEVTLIKTDSIGLLGGCSYETITITADEQMQITNQPSTSVSSLVPVINSSATAQVTDVVLSAMADCMQTFCPPAPVEDTCLASYFKTYRSNSYSDEIGKSFLMRNNKILAITRRLERVLGNQNQLSTGLKLFKENGIFEKGVTLYFMGISVSPFDMIRVDSSHVIMGNSNYEAGNNQVFTFSKVNDDLQLEWTVSYRVFNGYAFNSSGSTGVLTQDNDGNLYFSSVSIGFMENPKIMVMKMDKNGVQQWVRIYEVPGMYFLMGNAVAAGSRLIMVIEGGGSNGSTSLSIDKNTGQLLNIYKYPNDSDGWMYKRMLEYGNGKVFYAGNNKAGNLVLAVYDSTGKPIILKNTNQPSSGIRAATYKNGKLYGLYNFYTGPQSKNAFFTTDTSLMPLAYNEADIMLYGFPYSINVADNGNLYATGSFWHGGVNGNYFDGYIQKLEPDGKLGVCAADHPPMPLQNLNFTATPLSATTTSNQMTAVSPLSINLIADTHGMEVGEILCSSNAICTSIKLAGPARVCHPDQQQTYIGRRNIGCILRTQFEYDSSFLSIVSNTDTSLTVLFKKTGSTWLKVKLDAGCNVFTDSLKIDISAEASSFYLGPDTTLCPGNSLQLLAPANYQSYEWSDHTNAATLPVTDAGMYWITATNYCGETVSDTIVISKAIVPLLTLGKDTSVCINDRINLLANSGFSSYAWKGIGLLSLQGQNVQLVALQNTPVSVKAITIEGCISTDTLNVQVISAKPFSLGNDTSFCANGQVLLSVPDTYSEYQWNNGATGTSITINTKGTYWLFATDINGCKASDTMEVKQVFQLPVINIGPDGDICKGEARQFDPGSSYSSYVWHNGSVNRLFTATAPGVYWVRVSDANGCVGADTVEIRTELPVPVDFLAIADTICQYDKTIVEPVQSFSSYLWSNGSTQQTITIESPGMYELTVTGINGCTGKDTILIIEKFCTTGIFFPTAFSPNGDHLNDIYQPIIFGRVLSYRLELFNRFGQLVFSTTNPLKGWSGLFNGLEQPPSIFSWQCTYQLEGDKPTYKKGLVTLIR